MEGNKMSDMQEEIERAFKAGVESAVDNMAIDHCGCTGDPYLDDLYNIDKAVVEYMNKTNSLTLNIGSK